MRGSTVHLRSVLSVFFPIKHNHPPHLRHIASSCKCEHNWTEDLWEEAILDLTSQVSNGCLGCTAGGVVMGSSNVLGGREGWSQWLRQREVEMTLKNGHGVLLEWCRTTTAVHGTPQ